MSEKNSSSAKPVISLDEEGYIELHAGEAGNIITQLGKHESDVYEPWKSKIVDDIYYFTSYVVKDGYYPTDFASSYDFIQGLRDQSMANPYVENYVEKGMSYLIDYLNEKGIADNNTKYICINNNSDLTEITHDFVLKKTNNSFDDIVELKEDINVNTLFVSEDTPPDIRRAIEPILDELQKVDSYYSFEDLDFSKEELKYISGFNSIDQENLEKISKSDEIVLFCDVLSSGYTFIDVYNLMKKYGYNNIICFISLVKQV